MPQHSLDEMLEAHQRQCDYRYVQWLWLAGVIVTLLLTAGGLGWLAAQTLSTVQTGSAEAMDSVIVLSVRQEAQERRLKDLEIRSRVLDSLAVWVPRIERTSNETQAMVRQWR